MAASNNLWGAWLSGRTVRKHTMHVHRRENTAEHTWGALMLLAKYWPEAPARLVRYVLLHDAGEQGAADIPAHICWEMPELKAAVEVREREHVLQVMTGPHGPEHFELELGAEEQLVMEIVDRAEFALSCCYEFKLGNTMAESPLRRATERVVSTAVALAQDSPYRAGADHLSQDLQELTVRAEAA